MREYYRADFSKSPEVCHCCGNPVFRDEVFNVLSGLQRRIFSVVKRAGQAGIPRRDIKDIVYANDPSGGPDTNTISVAVCQMKPRLARFGLTIVSRGHSGYVLRTLDQVSSP